MNLFVPWISKLAGNLHKKVLYEKAERLLENIKGMSSEIIGDEARIA
jgi:hypothetical protein